MNKIFFLFSLFFASLCWGQSFTFDGSILTHDKKEIKYIVTLNIDSFYNVSGQSTKIINGQPCYSSLEGEFAAKNNTIFFIEHTTNKNCFELEFQGYISHIARDFYAIPGICKYDNHTGHINIICKNFKPNDKIKKAIDSIGSVDSNVLISSLDKNSNTYKKFKSVKSGDVESIESKSDSIYLKIYDQKIEDGDKISIYLNKKAISKNLELTKDGYMFKLKLIKGKNLLTIKAENEGRINFNTSKLELYNKDVQTYFINILNKREHATYEIYY